MNVLLEMFNKKSILITIFLPILFIIIGAQFLTSKPYMMISKDKYESHQDVDFDYEYAVENIMGYLNYKYDNLNFSSTPDSDDVLLRDLEIKHMSDVKTVYTYMRLLFLLGLIVVIINIYRLWKSDKKLLYKTLKYIWVWPVLFICFMGMLFLIDFNMIFTIFHEIVFSNDDWLLYSDDILIILLPLNFWLVSAVIILILLAFQITITLFINNRFIKKHL